MANKKKISNSAIDQIARKAASNIVLGSFDSADELYSILLKNVGNNHKLIIATLNKMVQIYENGISEEYKRYLFVPIVSEETGPNIPKISEKFGIVVSCYNKAKKEEAKGWYTIAKTADQF